MSAVLPGRLAGVEIRPWRMGPRTQLLACVGVALVVRVVVVLATSAFVPNTDASDFDRNALSLALSGHLPVASVLNFHGGATAFRPPAFSALLAVVYRIVGPEHAHLRWQAARLVEAGLGAVAVGLIWELGRRCGGVALGTVAAGLAAIYPPLILAGTSLLSESLFIPLLLGAVIAALEARRVAGSTRRWLAWSAATGVLCALAALSRSNGIVLVPALLAIASAPRGLRTGWRRLLGPAVVLLATALALTPWTIRNAEVFDGTFVPTTTETGFALAGVYNPEVMSGAGPRPYFWTPPLAQIAVVLARDPTADEAQVSDRLTHEAVDYIEAHPVSVLKESWASAGRLLGLDGTGFERFIAHEEAYPPELAIVSIYAFWAVGLLGLLAVPWFGIAARRRRRARRGGPEATHGPAAGPSPLFGPGVPALALWACPVLLVVSTLPVIGDARYRVPADPFLLLLVAGLLVALARRLAPDR